MKGIVVIMLALLCVNQIVYTTEIYPEHWWEPVDMTDAPKWEIFPHEAKRGVEVVLSKRNELGQHLSNLAHTPFIFKGKRYESVEGLWQSMKYPEDDQDPRSLYPGLNWEHTREEVEQMIGWDAMGAGGLASENMHKMGINWVSFEGKRMRYHVADKGVHYQLIKSILKAKVQTNSDVKKILLSTGNLILKSDHKMGKDTPPAWKYHEIYMVIRDEIRQEGKN